MRTPAVSLAPPTGPLAKDPTEPDSTGTSVAASWPLCPMEKIGQQRRKSGPEPMCTSLRDRYCDVNTSSASTICRGRESFSQALAFHPAFISAQLGLPMGRLELVVDDVACDGERSVGVEWHVELNGEPFPLSRGLSLATINAAGELERVVDIAEAPWRVVGLVVRPLLSIFGVGTAAVGAGSVFWLGQ